MLFYLALIYKKFNKNTRSLVNEDTYAHNLALFINEATEPDKIRKGNKVNKESEKMKVKYSILFSNI